MSAWTERDLQAYYDRLKKGGDAPRESLSSKTPQRSESARSHAAPVVVKAGAVPKERMNRWEREYAHILENRRLAGNVLWWAFEPMKLRLAGGAYYKPDFGVQVMGDSGGPDDPYRLEFHEVKGHWREAARVRIKVAAEHFPFKFIAVTRCKQAQGGGWKVEEFNGGR